MAGRSGSLHGAKQIQIILYAFVHLFNDSPDFLMTVTGKQEKRGSAQLVRHYEDGIVACTLYTAPQTPGERTGGDQLIPIGQQRASSEEHSPNKQVMFLYGEQGAFLDESVEYTVSKLFHSVQGRIKPVCGSFTVLFSKEGKIIKLFGVNIAAFGFKNATGRKACKILLAGLQLICPHDAHGLVSPAKRAGITLP